MKPRYHRLIYTIIILVLFGFSFFLALSACNDNLLFFYSPTELSYRFVHPQQRVRIGGIVQYNSVNYKNQQKVTFIITDYVHSVTVIYPGILPDLFREGQGIVAEGYYNPNNKSFAAKLVLAKHDENYMPSEVAKVLKDREINVR